jgi:hypothetical protein
MNHQNILDIAALIVLFTICALIVIKFTQHKIINIEYESKKTEYLPQQKIYDIVELVSALQSITEPDVKSAFIKTMNINVDELNFGPLLALYDSVENEEDEEDSEDDEEQSLKDAIIKFTEDKTNIDGNIVSGSTFPIARKLDTTGLIDLPVNPTVQLGDHKSPKEYGDSMLQRTNNFGMGVVGQISLNELRQRRDHIYEAERLAEDKRIVDEFRKQYDDHAYGAESIRVAEDERIVGELIAQCDARSKVNELLKSSEESSELKPVVDTDPENMYKKMKITLASPQMFYYDGKDNVRWDSKME